MINNQVDNHLWTHQAVFSRRYPLSSIKRVEVLYGPASAIYGPNAFLGIVNIVTYDGTESDQDGNRAHVGIHGGSYNTGSVDAALRGRIGEVAYHVSGRVFRSDEPNLSNRFGFISPNLYGDRQTWGPILDHEHRNRNFGTYHDPSDDNGVIGSVSYRGVKLGFVRWVRKEGYGPQYAADRVQNNVFWNTSGSNVYAESERQVTDPIKSKSLLSFRKSRTWGGWPEALPDWRAGNEGDSFISLTQWNSISNSWLFKQQFEANVGPHVLTGGFKFERKELTKAYDIPGYWNAFSSTVASNDPGPHGFGAGIGHSSDANYLIPAPPNPNMPPNNLAITEDIGGFVQGIWVRDPFRFNAGVRIDHNSLYGRSINPRISSIYRFSKRSAFKVLYGEAFQEPAPILLWGGWNGRLANPDLKPEEVRNIEAIGMVQTEHSFHDVSLFFSHYDNVIKEEAENAGSRDIWGIEYRARYAIPNFVQNATDISGFFNYTYTSVTSSIHFDHAAGDWVVGDTDLGDIAPHKINVGVNLPLSSGLNLRGNLVERRELYSQNPLRNQGKTIDPYLVAHGALSYTYGPFWLTLKISNLFDHDYFHPGVEQADSGDVFSGRSLGFRNSLIPQPGRAFVFRFAIEY